MAWNPNVPTITNRVQDDLNAIRENFRHFDPLAQVVGELQAVSGLAPYVQEILDSRIVEMGSNSNGTYVRWENGLQICWAGTSVIKWPEQTTANQGSYYTSSVFWTFPASFIDTNVTITTGIGSAGTTHSWGIATVYHTSVTTTSVQIGFWTTHARPEISHGRTVAIGRWK